MSCCVLKDTFDRELMRSFRKCLCSCPNGLCADQKKIDSFMIYTKDKSKISLSYRLLHFSLSVLFFWSLAHWKTFENGSNIITRNVHMQNHALLFNYKFKKKPCPLEWSLVENSLSLKHCESKKKPIRIWADFVWHVKWYNINIFILCHIWYLKNLDDNLMANIYSLFSWP